MLTAVIVLSCLQDGTKGLGCPVLTAVIVLSFLQDGTKGVGCPVLAVVIPVFALPAGWDKRGWLSGVNCCHSCFCPACRMGQKGLVVRC